MPSCAATPFTTSWREASVGNQTTRPPSASAVSTAAGLRPADLVVAADAAVHGDARHGVSDDPGELRRRFGVGLEQHTGMARVVRLGGGLERGDRSGPVRIRTEVAVQIDRARDVDTHEADPSVLSMPFPIGVADLAYASEPSVVRRAELARADGFAHIDVALEVDASVLALPVGCPDRVPAARAHLVLDSRAARGRGWLGPHRALVARRATGALRTVGGRYRELDRARPRPGRRGPGRAVPDRHRPRHGLGR